MSALHCRSQGRAYIDQQNAGLLSLFFTPPWPSQAQCNAFAQSREGGDVPFEVMLQGGSSYTVCCNGSIYQFRKPEARIDVNLINHARSIYVDFEPPTMEELRFGPLFVYRMSDMLANAVFYDAPNAVSARRTTHEGRVALRGIVRSVARFFATGFNNRPPGVNEWAGAELQSEYKAQLARLRPQVPARFHESIDFVSDQMKLLFEDRGAGTWPMVVANPGISPWSALGPVTPQSRLPRGSAACKHLSGFVSWGRAQVCPFGVAEASIDLFLGHEAEGTGNWRLCDGYGAQKRLFFRELKPALDGWAWDERIHVALELGQLLHMLHVLERGPLRPAAGQRLPEHHVVWDYLDTVARGQGMTDEEQTGRFWYEQTPRKPRPWA